MKKTLRFVMSFLVCLFLASCGNNTGDQNAKKNLDLHSILSSPVTEVIISSAGKEVLITDSEEIDKIVNDIESAEFQISNDTNINDPGAVSVTISVVMGSETNTITFPCFLYEGRVYSTDVEIISLFDKYFE